MQTGGLGSLTGELRDPPSSAVAGLPDEHLTHLADALASVRRRQAQELEAASARALEHIPRVLRGPVKKILGG
jgi:hypothetical protein